MFCVTFVLSHSTFLPLPLLFIFVHFCHLIKQERYIVEKAEYDKKCKILEQREADLKRRDLEFQVKLVQYEALLKEKQIKQQKLAQRLVEEERKCQELDVKAATLKESLRQKQQQLKTPEV